MYQDAEDGLPRRTISGYAKGDMLPVDPFPRKCLVPAEGHAIFVLYLARSLRAIDARIWSDFSYREPGA